MKSWSFRILAISVLVIIFCWMIEITGRLNFLASSINSQWEKVEVAYTQELSLVKQLHPEAKNHSDILIASYQQKDTDSYQPYLQKLKTAPEKLVMGISNESPDKEKNLPQLNQELDRYQHQTQDFNAYIDKPLIKLIWILTRHHRFDD